MDFNVAWWAGRYDNPILSRFLVQIVLKFQHSLLVVNRTDDLGIFIEHDKHQWKACTQIVHSR